MKRFFARVVPATALVGVMLLSAYAWSGGPRGEFDGERMLEHMAARMELTDSQQQKIAEIFSEGRDSAQADHRRLWEIREALRQQRGSFDAGEARELADELGEITSRMAYDMADRQARIYTLLTDEQRAQFDSFGGHREEHRRKLFNRHPD